MRSLEPFLIQGSTNTKA